VAAAREIAARAIFVGRRGAGGRLAQALIGSVSQKLAGVTPTMRVIVPRVSGSRRFGFRRAAMPGYLGEIG
jgi:nucleotide-binding universal stress UspA family protein